MAEVEVSTLLESGFEVPYVASVCTTLSTIIGEHHSCASIWWILLSAPFLHRVG